MAINLPSNLADIRNKIRRITARPSQNQITDSEIDGYINTFYVYDMPEHLKLESFRVNYQFITSPNIQVYDFDTNLYLNNMAPCYVGGYQSMMTQSRELYYRFCPTLKYIENNLDYGTGATGGYGGTLTNVPLMRGYNRNPASTNVSDTSWQVLLSAVDATGSMSTLVDDGLGNLRATTDLMTAPIRGTIDYVTGVWTVNALGFLQAIPAGNPIGAQYTPYVASRPTTVLFYQDQIMVYPIPDQAYTISFEAYKLPTAFDSADSTASPQLKELWQLLAYGASDKIFADNADIENMMKFRPLLEEQIKLCLRRTINQYSGERAATIYSDQTSASMLGYNNFFGGF